MTFKIDITVTVKPTITSGSRTSSSDPLNFAFTSTNTTGIVEENGTIDLKSVDGDVDLVFRLDDAPLIWNELPDIGSYSKTFRMDENNSGYDTLFASGDYDKKRVYDSRDYPDENAILTCFKLDESGKILTVGVRYRPQTKRKKFAYYYTLHVAVPATKRNHIYPHDPKIKNGGDTKTIGDLLENLRMLLINVIQSLRAIFRSRIRVFRDGESRD